MIEETCSVVRGALLPAWLDGAQRLTRGVRAGLPRVPGRAQRICDLVERGLVPTQRAYL